jgi:hypothetical protein
VEYWWYISCQRFTVAVSVTDIGIIKKSAPITRKFIGQHLGKLIEWCKADKVEALGD